MAEGIKRSRSNEDGDNYSKVQKTDKIRVKFLVPIYTAGAIIGEKGVEIKKLKEETSSQVHISEVNEFFPGTRERVVLCSGSLGSVLEVFKRINHKLRHEELPDKKGNLTQRQSEYAEKRRTIMKILVPTGIAGQVVGKKGENVKKIQEECGVKIDVTPNHKAIFNLNERAVDITGDEESVNGVGSRLLTMLSEDPEARMSGSLIYSGYCTPDEMGGGYNNNFQGNQGYGGPPGGGGYHQPGYNNQPQGGGYNNQQQGGGGYNQSGYTHYTGNQGSYGGYNNPNNNQGGYGAGNQGYNKPSGYGGPPNQGYGGPQQGGYGGHQGGYNNQQGGGQDQRGGKTRGTPRGRGAPASSR